MRYQEVFMVLLIFVSILGYGHGDDSSGFLKNKEDEVQTIAQAAQRNYARTCESVSTCQSQNCSRLECYPIRDQNSETTCVNIYNYTKCTYNTGPTCNTVEANFGKGYVRTPPLDFTFVGGSQQLDRELYFGSTICAQRYLDITFFSVNNALRSNSSLDYFYNLYFGSVDGSLRYYPGRELLSESCGVYDPRIRPWYTGAISILKDVVVLIDTGSAMQQTGFLDTSNSYIAKTKSLVKMLVKTFTEGDRVTVIPVNGSGSVGVQPFSQYDVPINWNFTGPNFQGLLSNIDSNSVFDGSVGSNGNGGPTNFTDGFVEAASTFAVSSPSSSMKIVILVTNSQSQNTPDPADLAAADNLTTRSGVKLFVYDLNPSTSIGWGAYACKDGAEPQLVSVNPLLWLSSYFSFLARARIAVSGNNDVFWQQPYTAASDVGEVITVAYPVMSADGLQLIGVAGIDVQMAGLDSNPLLKQEIEQLLTSSNYGQIAKNPKAGDLSICSTTYLDSKSCNVTPGQTQSLCNSSAQPATDDQLLALLCCQECEKEAKHISIAFWISLGPLGALVVLLVLSIIYLARRRKNKELSHIKKTFALHEYSYETLRIATNGFDESNIVGRGSFGVVYKASVEDESLAVKRLNRPADLGKQAEIMILGFTCHPNLLKLKGMCFQVTQCFLVYEFLGSSDLQDWLWPAPPEPGEITASDSAGGTVRFLSWNSRKKIARGLAKGLNYLHCSLEPNGRVFHLDIKPHNILLEDDFNPKIADLGISQLYEPGYTIKVASVERGKFGYIAPEVLKDRQVLPSSKIDVYSYGMVLLQLISGRKIDDPDCRPFLPQWARKHVDDGDVEKVVDKNLIVTEQDDFMAKCEELIRLALRCLSERPEERPEMSGVLAVLDTLRDVPDVQTPSFTDNSLRHIYE